MKSDEYSSNRKLCFWSDRLKVIEEKPQPISLVVGVTGRCNWNCEFCYLRDQEPLDLDYKKLVNFIYALPVVGIEITGGEPTLYKNLEKLVKGCYYHGIKIGMTTNGSYLDKLSMSTLEMFSWIRISINEYYDKKEIPYFSYIPENVYLGFNLIFHKKIENSLSMSYLKEVLVRNPNVKYLRIALDRNASIETEEKYSKYLERWGDKYEGISFRPITRTDLYRGKCYCGYIKPILEWDGNVYNCIAELEMYGHDSPNILTDINHPEKLLEFNNKEYFCKYCYFKDRNEFVQSILKGFHREFL